MSEKKEVLTESVICNHLNIKYAGNCRYKLANAFIFKHDWESDFFVQKQNGYAYEFEVKISRSDFFCDKKKVDKHLILDTGMFGLERHALRPNKFFYVVPEGLVNVNEVPKYAGLMYVPENIYGGIATVKEAPFLHKETLDFSSVLCPKFYNYWLKMKFKVRDLEDRIKYLESSLENHIATLNP
jgi:hypothetical protein